MRVDNRFVVHLIPGQPDREELMRVDSCILIANCWTSDLMYERDLKYRTRDMLFRECEECAYVFDAD